MGTSNIPVQLIARLTKASIVAVMLATLSSVQAADMTTDEVVTPTEQAVPERSDTVTIEIPVRKGLEYKLLMEKYAHLEYEWSTDGEELYFDFHGEPRGDTTGYFESFADNNFEQYEGLSDHTFCRFPRLVLEKRNRCTCNSYLVHQGKLHS